MCSNSFGNFFSHDCKPFKKFILQIIQISFEAVDSFPNLETIWTWMCENRNLDQKLIIEY